MEASEQTSDATEQRRSIIRVPVMADSSLQVAAWKVPPHWVLRDRPKPSMQLRVEMIDLSAGGMCLNILVHRLGPEAVAIGDRLRMELTHREETAVLDSQIVYRLGPKKEDGSVRVGLAFRKHDNTIEGRRAASQLDRVIAGLQRQNIKQSGATVSA